MGLITWLETTPMWCQRGSSKSTVDARGGAVESSEKQRIIQEFVPGKQVTLAHIIAAPDEELYGKIGLTTKQRGAIAVLTLTPGETAIIAADVATKVADVELGFVDRFSGSLVLVGQLAAIEQSVAGINSVLAEVLAFSTTKITRT